MDRDARHSSTVVIGDVDGLRENVGRLVVEVGRLKTVHDPGVMWPFRERVVHGGHEDRLGRLPVGGRERQEVVARIRRIDRRHLIVSVEQLDGHVAAGLAGKHDLVRVGAAAFRDVGGVVVGQEHHARAVHVDDVGKHTADVNVLIVGIAAGTGVEDRAAVKPFQCAIVDGHHADRLRHVPVGGRERQEVVGRLCVVDGHQLACRVA